MIAYERPYEDLGVGIIKAAGGFENPQRLSLVTIGSRLLFRSHPNHLHVASARVYHVCQAFKDLVGYATDREEMVELFFVRELSLSTGLP